MRRRAGALARLAGLYARHLAVRSLRRPAEGHGLARFAELYAAERITPVTPEERGRLPGQGLCVACGLCAFAAPGAGHLTAERLPLSLTRHLPDLWALRDLELGAVAWADAEAACPLGVRHTEIAATVAGRLRRDGVEPPRGRDAGPG